MCIWDGVKYYNINIFDTVPNISLIDTDPLPDDIFEISDSTGKVLFKGALKDAKRSKGKCEFSISKPAQGGSLKIRVFDPENRAVNIDKEEINLQ